MTSKIGAGVILKTLLNMDVDCESLPFGDEKGTGIETVVPVNGSVKQAEYVMKFE